MQVDGGVIVGKLPTRGPRERFGMVFEKGNTLKKCVNKAINNLWQNGTIKTAPAHMAHQCRRTGPEVAP